jgi:phospholipid/cholesterol/gamma-HCH transport system substrate-binding protein
MSDLAKVGAVVLIVLALLYGISQLVQGATLRLHTYFVLVQFQTGTGLRVGMPLKMGSYDIGYVEDVYAVQEGASSAMITEAKIRLNQKIHSRGREMIPVKIYSDAKFIISQEGLIGEKLLSVEPGSVPPLIDASQSGYTFTSGSSEDYISAQLKSVTGALSTSLFGGESPLGGTISKITGDLSTSMTNVNNLIGKATELITTNQGAVTASLDNIQKMSVNFLTLSKNLEDASISIKDLAKDPKYTETLKSMTDDLSGVSGNLNHLSKQLDELVSDPQVQQDDKDSVRLTTETLQEAKKTLERLQKSLDKADDVMNNANGLITDTSGAVSDARGKLNKLSSAGSKLNYNAGMTVRAVDRNKSHSLDNDDSYVADINAALGYNDVYLSAGADNIGEDNNMNFLLGWGNLDAFSVKGGVYRGELGIGASYNTPQGGGVDVMLFDTADPKLNAYGRIPIGNSVDVVLGVEDAQNDPQATVGVGVHLPK